MSPVFAGSVVSSPTSFSPGVGSLSVSDIITRVKKVFGDEADIQITSDDIMRWINDCQRDIAIENNLLQAKATASTVIGQSEYTIPDDTLTLRKIAYKGIRLEPLTLADAENNIPGFDDASSYPQGTPTHFWVWANRITLYPKPDAAVVGGLEVYYTRQPTPISALSDVPEIPTAYHNRIVEFCLAQAYELDEDFDKAQVKSQQFRTGVDRTKEHEDWTVRDSYPSITSVDDDY